MARQTRRRRVARASTRVAAGLAAGAAGTTALDAATYLDMLVRGRPASSTPRETVERLVQRSPLRIPGDDDTRNNRLQGAGPLMGVATGVSVGALAGAAWPVVRALPRPISAILLGAVAMGSSNASMTALGVTDPRTWSASAWVSDIVPHVAYGAVVDAVLRAVR